MQHLSYSIQEIASIVQGSLVPGRDKNAVIKDILIDSRKLIAPDNCLFFALVTRRGNGHRYLGELYSRGMRNFVTTIPPDELPGYDDANFIVVDDTLKALQALAKAHRQRFRIPVVGITGSNGKTIVKEWLFQLLAGGKKIVRSPKSYNSQLGVPLSVWQMDFQHELAIFEAGISEPEEMKKLQAIIQPDIGIFTNIGEAHSENFISKAQKVGEKLQLFTRVKTLIYCDDHSDIKEIIIRSELLKNIEAFSWSRKQDADLRILSTERHTAGMTKINGRFRDTEMSITIPFTDNASVENAIHCWAALLVMGYGHGFIEERFRALQPIAMRLELKSGINRCTVINDSYNSDINSLTIAIDFLLQQSNHKKKKTIILSDILQSGRNEEELYGEISAILENKGIERIIGIGPAIGRQKDKFRMDRSFYQSTDDFLRQFSFSAFQNEIILLKGARIFEFEQISRALEEKTHETVLEVNLNSLVHNLNYFRGRLPADVKIMAMVKAFSYGSGTFEIANTLQFHRVNYLAVAYADEGVELRKAGINIPVMVMNPDEQSLDPVIKHNLEPEIYSFRMLGLLERAIRKNIIPDNKPVKVHIKLDTGMHRLGFTEADIPQLVERLLNNKLIYTQSVFSHLAASEDPEHDGFSRKQIADFDRMSKKIIEPLDHPVLRHILNSAGISRFRDSLFDMVRLGISLYGVPSAEEDRDQLENVSTLRSIISQIKHIPEGDTVGYRREYVAESDITIGIVPLGYADGLRRSLGNGKGRIWLKDRLVPIIGNICMDMCMIDITGVEASEGDDVVVFGRENPLELIAGAAQTIPYEILTAIPPRVKRVYYQE